MRFATTLESWPLPGRLLAVLLLGVVSARAQDPINPWAGVPTAEENARALLKDIPALGPNDVHARPTLQIDPVYPRELVRSGLEGQVTIRFVVSTKGDVETALILRSNNPGFERAALEAVTRWKFTPAVKDGVIVRSVLEVPMIFRFNRSRGTPASGPPTPGIWSVQKPATWPENLPDDFKWTDAPVFLRTTYPVYPRDLLIEGKAADFEVGFVINPQGRVSEMYVIQGTPPGEMLASVRAMFASWLMLPARKDGKPCSAAMRLEFKFAPAGSDSYPLTPMMKTLVAELKRAQPRVVPLAELDRLPAAVAMPRPALPAWMGPPAPAGRAVIEFLIDSNGDAQLPRVVAATNPELGAIAAHSVAHWRFQAPLKGGRPVTARALVPIDFP